MLKNFWILIVFFISLVALLFSLNSLIATGGFNKMKKTLLELEFKMETKKYLLEAKAHLLEAKALYNFKKQPAGALAEIDQAVQFLGLARLTASAEETKKINEIHQELTTLEEQIKSGRPLGINFIDKTLDFIDRFLNLVRKP
jgi:hypothetical protein